MFKKLSISVLLVLITIVCFAQPSQYTPMTAAGYQFKRILTDSTLHLPSFCGIPTLRNSTAKNGALAIDTCNYKLYQWTNGNGWKVVAIDTTSLSNRINLKLNISDTSAMLTNYATDAQVNSKVDSLKRSSDSVFARKNGQWIFQYKDSTGGSTSIPTLQQVTDAGNTTTNNIIANEFDAGVPLLDNTGTSITSAGFFSVDQINEKSSQLNQSSLTFSDLSGNWNIISPIYPLTTADSLMLPVTNSNKDTISTLADIRNNTIDTANKWVNNITRTPGKDSIIYYIGSTRYAIKDSIGGSSQNGRFGNDTATVVMAKVHNDAGVTLTNGKVVYLARSGTNSNAPSVKLANNKADSTSANTFGFVSGTIAVNDTGYIIISGQIEKLNTSAFSNGDIIYLDSISGQWTKTKPVAPYHMVYLGVVVKSNAGNGSIFVKCQNGYELDEIHDVLITNKLNNQVLVYSDTQKVWKNRNIYSIVDTTTTVATKSNVALKLNISDTASMLSKYLRKSDTTSLSNRINLKLNISDTSSMLNPYLRKIDTTSLSNRINLKLNISDTASMLNPYAKTNLVNTKLNISDTSSMLSTYQRSITAVKYTDTASMLLPYLRKIDTTNKFVNNITRTVGKDSIIFFIGGNRYAIKDSVGGGGSYTFSTGLTNTSGTVTNNLSTGVTGGQSVIGGNAASNSLTLSSTSNATKGKLLFGTSAYDEVNNRLGIGTASPATKVQVEGTSTEVPIIALNTSGSLTNNQYFDFRVSGLSKFQFGYTQNLPSNRFFIYNNTNVTDAFKIFESTNNIALSSTGADAGYKLDVNGTGRFTSTLTLSGNTFSGNKFVIGNNSTYKNGATTNTPLTIAIGNGSGAGVQGYAFDASNTLGFLLTAGNGSTHTARASMNIVNLTNTAGSESGDLAFSTQSEGASLAERMRITSGGGITLNYTNTAAGTTGNQTINKPSGTVNIASAGTSITVTNSLVTTSSLVFATIRTNDATAVIKNVVPASGSFTINLNAAATAETSIGFFVINQ